MKQMFFSGLFLCSCLSVFAQSAEPLFEVYFSDPDKMIEDEGGGYHFNVKGAKVVSMSDEGRYKLMDGNGKVVEEGNTEEGEDIYLRHGSWKEYYSSGKIKAEGVYFKGNAYGLWKQYDVDGNLQRAFSIVPMQTTDGIIYCKAGMEQLYYSNGNLKEEHFFKAEPFEEQESIEVEDPETEKKIIKTITKPSFKPVPFGIWIYYNQDGTVIKEEEKRE